MWLQSVQYDLQHDFVWMTDEAYCSVVLALLQVAFLGMCDDQGLGPQGWPNFYLPDPVADCRQSDGYVLSTCLDSSAGRLSTLANFPVLQPPLLCEGWSGRPLCLGTVQY